jgi:hypothetical protein
MGNDAEYKNNLDIAKKFRDKSLIPLYKKYGYKTLSPDRTKGYWEGSPNDSYYQEVKYKYSDNPYNTPNLPPDFYNTINAQKNNTGGK